MPNMYSIPLESKFINTHVPIPFQEMMQAGQMIQERYDKGASALNTMVNQMDTYTGIGQDRTRMEAYQQAIKGLSEQYLQKDLGNSFVINDLNRDARKTVPTADLKDIMASKAAFEAGQKEVADLKSKGLWNEELNDDPSSTWDSSGGKIYKWSPTAYTPKEHTLDPMFDEIRETSYKGTIRDPKDVNYGMDIYATDDKDVAKVIGKNLNSYLSTPSGQNEVRIAKNKMRKAGIKDEDMPDDTAIAKNIMLETGERYKRVEHRGSRADARLRAGADDDTGAYTPSITVPYQSVDSVEGRNDKQKLKTLEENHQVALTILQNAPKGPDGKTIVSDAIIKAQGIVDRDNRVKDLVMARVEKQIGTTDQSIKNEAFKKLRALNVYKNVSDQEIWNTINTQLGDGLSSGLHRFGTAVNNLEDHTAMLIARGLELVNNIAAAPLTAGNIATNPIAQGEYMQKIYEDLDTTRPFKLGDIFTVLASGIKNMYTTNKTNVLTDQVDKEASKHDLNILRQLSLDINGRQDKVKDEFDKQYLQEFQHINTLEAFYPVSTKLDTSNDTEYVTNHKGQPIAPSYTHMFIKSIPSIIDNNAVVIKEKDNKGNYKVLSSKQVKEAKGEFLGWDVVNKLTFTGTDPDGNIVLHLGLASPKPDNGKGWKQSSEYEVRVPANASVARGFIADRFNGGQIEAGIKLSSTALINEFRTYKNEPNGHEYNIETLPNMPKEVVKVEPDPKSANYLMKFNGEYLRDPSGNMIPLTDFEVEGQLRQIQSRVLTREKTVRE